MLNIYAVSDGTGKTAEGVVRAALTQYDDPNVRIVRLGGVRVDEKIRDIVSEALHNGGFIVHTLVSTRMRHLMFTEGRAANVATIDLMGQCLLDSQSFWQFNLDQNQDCSNHLRKLICCESMRLIIRCATMMAEI